MVVSVGQIHIRLLQRVVQEAKIRRPWRRGLRQRGGNLRAFSRRKTDQADRKRGFWCMHGVDPERASPEITNLATFGQSDKARTSPHYYFPYDKIEWAGNPINKYEHGD
jgi:hypothetical protein